MIIQKNRSIINRIKYLFIQININKYNKLSKKNEKYLDKNLDLIDDYSGNDLIEEKVTSVSRKMIKQAHKIAKLIDNKKYKFDSKFYAKNFRFPDYYTELDTLRFQQLPSGSWSFWQRYYPLILTCYDFGCEKRIEKMKERTIKQQVINFKINRKERKRIEKMNKDGIISHNIRLSDLIEDKNELKAKQLKEQQEQEKVTQKEQQMNEAEVSNESEQ